MYMSTKGLDQQMETFPRWRDITVALLLLLQLMGAQGRKTIAPKDSVILNGNTSVFTCCSNGQDTFFWKHKPVGSKITNDIYDLDGLVNGFRTSGRFNVTRGSNPECQSLGITDVQLKDAGTYTCVNNEGLGQSIGWELVVLESFDCEETNRKAEYMGINDFGFPQDVISLACITKYFGNIRPRPTCAWSSKAELHENSYYHRVTETNFTTTLNIHLPARKELNGYQLSCYPYTAEESITSQYPTTWKSAEFIIEYALFRQNGVSQCNREELSLDCQPQCNYKMGQFSNGSSYCKIIYPGRTHPEVYVLLPENTDPQSPTPQGLLSDKGTKVLTYTAGVLVIICIAQAGVFVFKCIKARSKQTGACIKRNCYADSDQETNADGQETNAGGQKTTVFDHSITTQTISENDEKETDPGHKTSQSGDPLLKARSKQTGACIKRNCYDSDQETNADGQETNAGGQKTTVFDHSITTQTISENDEKETDPGHKTSQSGDPLLKGLL